MGLFRSRCLHRKVPWLKANTATQHRRQREQRSGAENLVQVVNAGKTGRPKNPHRYDWTRLPRISVGKSKEDALLEHKAIAISKERSVRVYTDGSMRPLDSMAAGAAAYFAIDGLEFCCAWYLGTGKTTVEIETQGLSLSLDVVQAMKGPLCVDRVHIFLDSQAVLGFLQMGESCTDRAIREIHTKIQRLMCEGVTVDLIWIPGHRSIVGNILAHRAATLAANCMAGPAEVTYVSHTVPVYTNLRFLYGKILKGDGGMQPGERGQEPLARSRYTNGIALAHSASEGGVMKGVGALASAGLLGHHPVTLERFVSWRHRREVLPFSGGIRF